MGSKGCSATLREPDLKRYVLNVEYGERKNIFVKLVAVAFTFLPIPPGADAVDNAFRFRTALDGTGLLSSPARSLGGGKPLMYR